MQLVFLPPRFYWGGIGWYTVVRSMSMASPFIFSKYLSLYKSKLLMVKVYVGRGEIEIIFCVSCLHLKWRFEKAIMAKVKPPLFGTFLQNGSKKQSKQASMSLLRQGLIYFYYHLIGQRISHCWLEMFIPDSTATHSTPIQTIFNIFMLN